MRALLFLFSLFFLNLSAQVKFEKGYFIDEANNRTECLIKNYDWIRTPTEIEYKITKESAIQTINTMKLNAFQVYETNHYYKKFKFQVDSHVDSEKELFQTEISHLRVLVEGKASLYEYQGKIYFYQVDESEIKQLKYKIFTNSDSKKQEDLGFRTELYTALKCDEKISQLLRNTSYRKNDLANIFSDYNQCQKAENQNFISKKSKSEFHIKAVVGVNFNTLKRDLKAMRRTLTIENQSVNFIAGIEMEMLLPFNNKKWSFFLAPNFQNQKEESSKQYDQLFGGYSGTLNTEHNYSYIEIPIGVRHYFLLNEKSKLYTDFAFGYILILSSTEKLNFIEKPAFPELVFEEEEKKKTFFRIGLGYNYNQYNVAINYYPVKNLMQSNVNGSVSLSLGCRLN